MHWLERSTLDIRPITANSYQPTRTVLLVSSPLLTNYYISIMTIPVLLLGIFLGIAGSTSSVSDLRSATTLHYRTNDPILRGAPIGESPVVSISDVKEHPDQYSGKTVILEGTIEAVCQNKGCWMEITSHGSGLRVTFKDYGFFVPKDSKGKVVRAEGVIEVKTLSKADADHLAGEGASIHRNEDGTATEVGFVASGVEIREG